MVQRTRRVVTAIDATGKAFSEVHYETQVGEKWYLEDPISLASAGPEVEQWKKDFNAAVQAENALLKEDIETLTAERASLSQQLAEVTAQVVALQPQVDTIPSKNQAIAELQTDLIGMTVERDEWREKAPPPKGPRDITPAELFGRIMTFAPASIKKIWQSETDIAAIASATLFTWPGFIDLDSEKLKELLGGLVQAELLTQEELDKVLE